MVKLVSGKKGVVCALFSQVILESRQVEDDADRCLNNRQMADSAAIYVKNIQKTQCLPAPRRSAYRRSHRGFDRDNGRGSNWRTSSSACVCLRIKGLCHPIWPALFQGTALDVSRHRIAAGPPSATAARRRYGVGRWSRLRPCRPNKIRVALRTQPAGLGTAVTRFVIGRGNSIWWATTLSVPVRGATLVRDFRILLR